MHLYLSNSSPSDPTIQEPQISHNNIFEHLRVKACETKQNKTKQKQKTKEEE